METRKWGGGGSRSRSKEEEEEEEEDAFKWATGKELDWAKDTLVFKSEFQ